MMFMIINRVTYIWFCYYHYYDYYAVDIILFPRLEIGQFDDFAGERTKLLRKHSKIDIEE